MAFSKDAPDYAKWEKAKGIVTKARDLWLKYRETDPTKADTYKNAYTTAKDLQNDYAAKVRAYVPVTQAPTPPKNVGLDSSAQSDAIKAGQSNSGTDTTINKVVDVKTPTTTSTTTSTNTNSNSNSSNSGNTDYTSVYGGDKNTTSNNVNDTNYSKKIEEEKVFNASTASDNYKTMSNKLTEASKFSGDMDKAKESAIKAYGSLDAYAKKYQDQLKGYVESGKLTSGESQEINKQFINFMSSKLGYESAYNDVDTKINNAGTGQIKTGTNTYSYVDSDGETHTSTTDNYETIDYNEITERVGGAIFGNETFSNNFNSYIDNLKATIKDQRTILEAQQAELTDMFKNQEADFQGQFGNIYSGIEKREAETKAMFGDIEAGIKTKFEDIEKTMGEQKSGEKASIEANLRAKGLSEGAISNALTKIDNKYEQSSRSAYSAYTDNMKSLAGEYDKLAANITSAKSSLTQQKLAFSNALIERSKALIDGAAQFDSDAVKTLTQPVTDMYKSRLDASSELEQSTRAKQEKQERYKQATAEERLYILNDYRVNMQSLGVKIENATPEMFRKAAEFDNQAEALLYLTAQLNGNDSTSGNTGNEKLDNFVNIVKESITNETVDNKITNAKVDSGELPESQRENQPQKKDENLDNDNDPRTEIRNGVAYYDGRPDEGGGGSEEKNNGSTETSFNIDEIPSGYANKVNENIERAIEGYYNRRGINGVTPLIGFQLPWTPEAGGESTAGYVNDRDVKSMKEYSDKLDKNYPGVAQYTEEKLKEAITKVEKAKEGLISDIANGTALTKTQAAEFIEYRISKSPKDILLNANKPSSYIDLINAKVAKGISQEDIIK